MSQTGDIMSDRQGGNLEGGKLKGRVALITGGSRGIGREFARAFAAEGARLVLTARGQAGLDTLVEEITTGGGEAIGVVADALDRDQARMPVDVAVRTYGTLDILINNVGGTTATSPEQNALYTHDDDVFANDLILNLTTAYWTSRAAAVQMKEAGGGRIIMIGSGAAKVTGLAPMAYTVAKHGLLGLTRKMAELSAADGITVNCLCPGPTNTEMLREGLRKRREVDPGFYDQPPNMQGRILEPEELAPMAVLLASAAGSGITGQVISVDGGYGI